MERNHFTMKCPADYNNSMQSDSDSVNNTEYIQEVVNAPPSPVSPQLSGGLSSAYRKRQREKKSQGRQDSFDAANKLLNDKRNRITTPTQEEDDDEISRPATESIRQKKKYVRNKPSVVWKHVKKLPNVDKVECNHCASFWWNLLGSTSTPLKHVKEHHYNKLTDEQKDRMSKNGETSGKGGTVPKRTLCKKKLQYGPLPRSDKKVMRVDAKLGRLLISSSASWTLLDNPEFGLFCEEIFAGRYNVPTRGYMLDNVINPMFHEAK